MAILIERPICRKVQTLRHKTCDCGEDLDKAKRSQRVKYYIHYRLPNKKQLKQLIGSSIAAAREADVKRKGQKREGRIFDMVPDAKITFNDLTEWYLTLEKNKSSCGV